MTKFQSVFFVNQAEVTISIDGVAVQEPKGKKILHQFPLHQISYCADDKAEKKFFSFIAKDGEIHRCFVFASEKLVRNSLLSTNETKVISQLPAKQLVLYYLNLNVLFRRRRSLSPSDKRLTWLTGDSKKPQEESLS